VLTASQLMTQKPGQLLLSEGPWETASISSLDGEIEVFLPRAGRERAHGTRPSPQPSRPGRCFGEYGVVDDQPELRIGRSPWGTHDYVPAQSAVSGGCSSETTTLRTSRVRQLAAMLRQLACSQAGWMKKSQARLAYTICAERGRFRSRQPPNCALGRKHNRAGPGLRPDAELAGHRRRRIHQSSGRRPRRLRRTGVYR